MADPLLTSDGRYYDVNFFEYRPGQLPSDVLPTSFILCEALATLPYPASARQFLLDVRAKIGLNKALWGVRKAGDVYSLEFYFYYPRANPCNRLSNVVSVASRYFAPGLDVIAVEGEEQYYLTSVNMDGEHVTDVTVYESVISDPDAAFFFADKGLTIDEVTPIFHSYSLASGGKEKKRINTYFGFFDPNSLHQVMRKVHDVACEQFPDEDPLVAYEFLQYAGRYFRHGIRCRALVASKVGGMGVYLLGLDIDELINVLEIHDYDEAFIRSIRQHARQLAHVKIDMGMDFHIRDGRFVVKKTAFWGSV